MALGLKTCDPGSSEQSNGCRAMERRLSARARPYQGPGRRDIAAPSILPNPSVSGSRGSGGCHRASSTQQPLETLKPGGVE
jgi:hypothetical protein